MSSSSAAAVSRLTKILTSSCPSVSSSLPHLTSSLTPSTMGHYSTLLEDVLERRRLQRLDTGAENKLSAAEMTKRSAHRAGFEMPEKYDGGGGK
ncbi:hypothetical protein TrRE_jg631 [Triparma retinervis]|uniref:Uncharacterized protein n=1 Tax=Triparma retinervis TaxID=2557542 RepID=A0A9W7DT11_9STRA|nr:hypothetical protein TrRE_jg631 [Triparma retinervis]